MKLEISSATSQKIKEIDARQPFINSLQVVFFALTNLSEFKTSISDPLLKKPDLKDKFVDAIVSNVAAYVVNSLSSNNQVNNAQDDEEWRSTSETELDRVLEENPIPSNGVANLNEWTKIFFTASTLYSKALLTPGYRQPENFTFGRLCWQMHIKLGPQLGDETYPLIEALENQLIKTPVPA